MPQRVRLGGMQDRAGITVYHDVRIARLVAGAVTRLGLARLAVGSVLVVRAGERAARHGDDRNGDEAENTKAQPVPGFDPPRQHASPVRFAARFAVWALYAWPSTLPLASRYLGTSQ